MEAALKNNQNESKATKKHPPGLYLLFFTEMWERFSYYGMRAILVLYLTTSLVGGGLAMSDSVAMSIYGFFTGAVYFTPLLGGYLSDRFLGRRLAITIGGVTMAIGNIVMFAVNSHAGLYLGLALLIIGNGFFKPNISTIVGELYAPKDKRRDAAFTIFYMGINIGAFFSPLVVGFLADDYFKTTINGVIQHGYKYGFLTAAVGMIIGQLIFNLFGNRYLGDLGKKPVGRPEKSTTNKVVAKQSLTKEEKQRTAVIMIITCFVIFFWAGFEQAGGSLTLYTDKFINRGLGGWTVPTAWFQSLNPLFIVILAPILSVLWVKLSNSKRGDIPTPSKMALGMILLGAGFIVLIPAIMKTGSDAAHITVKANMLFMVFTYFLHTLGELCLSPVGLSLVSKLAPAKIASLLMGVWLAGSGAANILAGQLGAFSAKLGYLELYIALAAVPILLGLILLAMSKKLVKMMN